MDPLFLRGLIFTVGAVLIAGFLVWFLYYSPLKGELVEAKAPSTELATRLAIFLAIAAVAWIVGAIWDASMHLQTGEIPAGADFLWPPHLLLYSGFLIAFIVAASATGWVAVQGWRSGERDPRRWIRQNPYLGAVAIASLFELMAIPGDAIWHEIFGEDLTAWSPPHVLLGAMATIVILSAISVLLKAHYGDEDSTNRSIAVAVLLGLALNVAYILGVLEWEMPERSGLVDARPIWLYPLVGGLLAFITFVLAKHLIPWRWSATITAVIFYTIRLAVSAGLSLTGNISPAIPLLFIFGAVLMDILPAERIRPVGLRWLAVAGVFTIGFALAGFPALLSRANLPALSTIDIFIGVITILAASFILLP